MGRRGRTIVVGDVHGCWDELEELLRVVELGAGDRVIGIGDVVDRGPDTPRVLEFFATHEDAITIQGNHERKHVRSARGEVEAALSQRIARLQLGDSYDDWIAWMDALPRYLELDDAVLTHGFWEPGVPAEDQEEKVLVGTLSGEAYLDARIPAPWYELYEGPKPIVVGHRDYLGTGEPLVRDGLVYALDTGCVHGGRLTALILPGFELVSVPARTDYWLATQERYAALAGPKRENIDLDWKTLRNYANAVNISGLPERTRRRAEKCARIAASAARTVEQVVSAVKRRAEEIEDDLSRRGDWPRLDEHGRAKRFAKEAQRSSDPGLLFQARRGTLEEAVVYRAAKNARRLVELAERLGVPCEIPAERQL